MIRKKINIFKKEFQNISKVTLHPVHFLLTLVLTVGFAIGIFIISFLLGWLCCMEPAASASMFSDFTVFGVLTTDLIVLLLLLRVFYNRSKKKANMKYCKSYLLIGFMMVIMYLVSVYIFIIN